MPKQNSLFAKKSFGLGRDSVIDRSFIVMKTEGKNFSSKRCLASERREVFYTMCEVQTLSQGLSIQSKIYGSERVSDCPWIVEALLSVVVPLVDISL